MTDKETLKRIEEDAYDYMQSFNTEAPKYAYRNGFVAGAKSERNKAIDDCIQVLENNPGDMNLVPLLESLKL